MAKMEKVTQFPVQVFNWAFLALVLISAPYVASMQLGGYQIVERRTAQCLAMWAFALAISLNLAGAMSLFRRKARLRRLCFRWSAIHLFFLLIVVLVFLGYLRFDWLREWLVSLGL